MSLFKKKLKEELNNTLCTVPEKYKNANHTKVIKQMFVSGDYSWSIMSTSELYQWICNSDEADEHMSSQEFVDILNELKDDGYIYSFNVTLNSATKQSVSNNLFMLTDKFADFVSAGFIVWDDVLETELILQTLGQSETEREFLEEVFSATITKSYFSTRILTYEKLFSEFGDESSFREYISGNVILSLDRTIGYFMSPEVELIFHNICENFIAGKFYRFSDLNQSDKLCILKLFSLSLVKGFFDTKNNDTLYVMPNLKYLVSPSNYEFTWQKNYDFPSAGNQVDLMFDDVTYDSFVKSISLAENIYSDKDANTDIGYIAKNEDVFSSFIQIDESDIPLKDFYMKKDIANIYHFQILLALRTALGDNLTITKDTDPNDILDDFIENCTELTGNSGEDEDNEGTLNQNTGDDFLSDSLNNTSIKIKNIKLTDDEKSKLKTFTEEYTVPKIIEFLDENIAGQNGAKKACALLLYKKVLQVLCNDASEEQNFESSNMLIAGPTGCGKTFIWNTLKKISPIPIFIHDVSAITIAGYKGDDLSVIFSEMIDYMKNGMSKMLLESSFFILDEFDKICQNNNNDSTNGFNRQMQGQMLSIVEGTDIRIKRNTFSTKNMEFVFLGAFEDIYTSRKEEKPRIGFAVSDTATNTASNKTSEITMDDIIKYGLRSELAGRIGNFVTINELTEDEMKSIIRIIPANLVKKAKEKYKMMGFDVEIAEDAADKIANIAFKKKLGARSMKKLLDCTIDSVIFLNCNTENSSENRNLIRIKKENVSTE